VLSIAAFMFGGLALLFLPFILGPLGLIFGFVANSKGDRIGKWAGLMSIATTVLGIAFSVWISRQVGVSSATDRPPATEVRRVSRVCHGLVCGLPSPQRHRKLWAPVDTSRRG
jgi:hypothetical protein